MDLCLKVVIGHFAPTLSDQFFTPTDLDLCVVMVSGSAPYRFKAPVGEEVFRMREKAKRRSMEKLEVGQDH